LIKNLPSRFLEEIFLKKNTKLLMFFATNFAPELTIAAAPLSKIFAFGSFCFARA
jgi:hypothetical protein